MKTSRAGDRTSCNSPGHVNSGSDNVFINGRGATRVNIDMVNGNIIRVGETNKLTVFVNGFPLSVNGDRAEHGNDPPHTSAKTANGSEDVLTY